MILVELLEESTPTQAAIEVEQDMPSGHIVYPGAQTLVDAVTVGAGLNDAGQVAEDGMKNALLPVPHF
jgi:hypothetical protein